LKCCGCGKEIDINDHSLKDGLAQWFGTYTASILIRIICVECISDPTKKQKYVKGN